MYANHAETQMSIIFRRSAMTILNGRIVNGVGITLATEYCCRMMNKKSNLI